MKKTYIGTSGYQYKDWAENFYPSDIKRADWLGYYAGQFNSVEINSSFYQLPSAKTIAQWRDSVPDDFVFALKGSRYITHLIRLKDPAEHIDKLFRVGAKFGDRLGVVLWQLPASFHEDLDRLGAFCETLAQHKMGKNVPQAIELRHVSWFKPETYALLHKYDMALVVNQSSRWPLVEVSTASWSYFRFHGPKKLYNSSYSKRELADWAAKVKKLTKGNAFAYFNNDNGNYAPKNAETLCQSLEQPVHVGFEK